LSFILTGYWSCVLTIQFLCNNAQKFSPQCESHRISGEIDKALQRTYGRSKVGNELVDNIWGRAMHVQADIHLLRQRSDSICFSISTNSYCLARSGLDISICFSFRPLALFLPSFLGNLAALVYRIPTSTALLQYISAT